MSGVLIVGVQQDGRLTDAARSALEFGRRVAEALHDNLECVLVGEGSQEAAETAIACGATRVYTPKVACSHHDVSGTLAQVEAAAKVSEPSVICCEFDAFGKEIVGRLACRLEAAVVSEVQGFVSQSGSIQWQRPVYGGKAIGTYGVNRSVVVVGVRPKAEDPAEPDQSRRGAVVEVAPPPVDQALRAVLIGEPVSEGVRMADARVIVAGGRGLGGPEGFKDLEQLAEVLGGAVGASRAACDAGWAPSTFQVGQTGSIVAPDLYVAVGISGASQHLAGIASAKTVVAVNKDPEAPIFKRADLGIVADYREVLPALTEEFRRLVAKA
jgi:electron transfer flavoprotein alpha subunit